VANANLLVALLAGCPLAPEGLGSAEWEGLVALAVQHKLALWLCARPKSRAIAAPGAIAGQLEEIYLSSAAHNMRLFHELGAILRAFQAAGIPVMPLKGACLAEEVYGDRALRLMFDIDLLVRPRDVEHAVDVLRALGYDANYPFDPVAEQAYSQHMPPMSRPGAVGVELH
jgi:hypothetical protein